MRKFILVLGLSLGFLTGCANTGVYTGSYYDTSPVYPLYNNGYPYDDYDGLYDTALIGGWGWGWNNYPYYHNHYWGGNYGYYNHWNGGWNHYGNYGGFHGGGFHGGGGFKWRH